MTWPVAVGVVEAEKIVTVRHRPRDKMIGLPSSGSTAMVFPGRRLLEEAKFSLDRYFPELGRNWGRTPTKICQGSALRRFPHQGFGPNGGGLVENIPRILPPGCQARIQCRSWPVPSIFQLIRQAGRITAAEMYRVFNMGIGLVIIAAPDVAEEIRAGFSGSPPPVIGEIVAGQRVVELVEGE